ncbi:Vacuolar amino acid transporter 3 [Seminavis robusta]|uniref:Vacuolar amino acid transporter 3 n=1 Tax=Seminavis robusta TaxID=568900 RepID=A0A9N8EV26_9STRA|nr:Vacuolar amino acid transporter 3 [Seminavis robusta]|eukprot:Sro1771_g296600.1 Vacuolar amino acid transporter 3 (625) ;mRNA; f:3067-5132
MDDTLAPLPSSQPKKKQPNAAHLKTYTAGEDEGRLAEMAKEFGLAHQRQPKKQVRDETKRGHHRRGSSGLDMLLGETGKKWVNILVQDSSVEVARMRAVYSLGYPRRAGSFSEYGATSSDRSIPSSHRRRGSLMPEWLEQIEYEEEDLHAHGVGGDLTSAVLGIVKGMVGPAILYLPHGLANAGYAVAFPMILVTTLMFLYSSQCLLDSWKMEHEKMHRPIATNKGGTPTIDEEGGDDEQEHLLNDNKNNNDDENGGKPRYKMTFLSYPELAYRALGETGERIIKIGIGLMQSGVCLTYLIFVPQNFSTALLRLANIYVAPEWFLVVMVAIQVPLSWIRDIRKLTVTNFLANALILYGLITCLALSLKQAMTTNFDGAPLDPETKTSPLNLVAERLSHLSPFAQGWFLFIGTSVLLFEGSITLLVPLQEAVVSDEDRQRFPSVYRTTILSIIVFYIFFSMTCWTSLGNDVRTVLTTSLPVGNAATSVQLAYSIAVIFTFPLQNFPALEITCRSIANAMDSCTGCGGCPSRVLTQRNVISSLLVGLLAIIAVTAMNSLDKVVSLMGGLLGCPIAFVFPPIIHYQLAKATPGKELTRTRIFFNGLVCLLGVVATVIATSTTLLTWD